VGSYRLPGRLLAALGILVLLPAVAPAASKKATAKPRAARKSSALPAPKSLGEALSRAALRAPAPSSGLSIEIAELETGQTVFEKNPQQPETIASVTKLFSTAAALHFLGPDYKFKTTFWRRGDVHDGTLVGSLLVVGGGDPNISGRFYSDDYNAVFDKWAQGLAQAGILRVSGDLILDTSFFDSVTRHPEWRQGQEARWYQAPVSALSYNDNVVVVSIRPGPKPGKPATVSIEPETAIVRPVSWARTVRRGRPRLAVRRSFGSGDVMVSGTVPSRSIWWSTPVAIDDPPAFFGSVLRSRLENAGIPMLGKVVENSVEPDNSWVLIAETESGLLPSLAVTNKRSQGFYAEQVFKTLAAEKTGKGSWSTALTAQKEFLAAVGLDPARFELRDGSGLSPLNRAAAGDVVAFLRAMNAHPYGSQWKATLAVSGDPEGTLRHRLRDAELQGRILGKTGSLSGVSTLAGYATAASGKTYVFSILLNGSRVWDSNGHAYQDRILRALVRHG
jgi:D-alanyl-D-alanine carboxypeptidase/D-alanyl-D-alanine-endopeptidase (penicillin-binding protein 4)